MVTHHGRDQIDYVKVGAKRDGTLTAWHSKIIADVGAYQLLLTPLIPPLSAFVMCGVYNTPAVVTDVTSVHTNKFPTDAIRGAGRPEATHMIEVVMDQLAHELGMDPLELRRKNFIPPFLEGHETPIGVVYDSGNYAAALDKLLEHIDPAQVHREAEALRSEGIYRGIGFSTYTEICGNAPSRAVGPGGFGLQGGGWESATVRVHATGAVTLYTGTSPHGQGHETGFAQIVADRLGIDPAQVEVIHGDTDTGPFGLDTYGSRSLAVGGEAAARAADKVAAKAKAIVAHQLEAAPEDIELNDGKFSVRGSPDKGLTLAEVAGAAYMTMDMPEGMEPGTRRAVVLRPRELRVPVRRARVRGRRRPGDGKGQGRPLGRGRRLRSGDQPDADRRPGARRNRARDRAGAVRAHPLRRGRSARDRHVRGLRARDGGRAAQLRDRPYRDPEPRQLASASRASARPARSPRPRRSPTP